MQKPVLFTEMGYPEAEPTAPANPALQKRCYAAAIHVRAGKPWLQGLIWWGWSPFAEAGGLCDPSYTPQPEPAQALL